VLDDRREDAAALSERVIGIVQDPEAWLMQACALAHVGRPDRALELLERIVDRGYYGLSELGRNPWCASIRDRAEFTRILGRAAQRREEVRKAFVEAGGAELLGIGRAGARAS
jgi:hypothetical protein